jgi:hypothetical protein
MINLKLFREALSKLPPFPWFFGNEYSVIFDKKGSAICEVIDSEVGVAIADMPATISVLLNKVEHLEEQASLNNFNYQTLELYEKEIYNLRNIIQVFIDEYEAVDDSAINDYGELEIDDAFRKLKNSYGDRKRAMTASLTIIRDTMVQSGIPKEFADDALSAAIIYEGVEHLMMIWYEPVGDEFYKQEIIADIQEIIDDIKASKPLNKKE